MSEARQLFMPLEVIQGPDENGVVTAQLPIPKKVKSVKSKKNNKIMNTGNSRVHSNDLAITFCGKEFLLKMIDGEMVSLTDIWRMGGSSRSNEVSEWLSGKYAKDLIAGTSEVEGVAEGDLVIRKRGGGGGTYAHPTIASRYAQYLDTRLAALVERALREAAKEHLDPELKLDRSIDGARSHFSKLPNGKDDNWVDARLISAFNRNGLTSTLKAHGVDDPKSYKNITNEEYQRLFGGTAATIRDQRGLPKKTNLRDHLSMVELAAVALTEALAAENIKKEASYGDSECFKSVSRSAGQVRVTLELSKGKGAMEAITMAVGK
jgi:hypothetical protein